MNEAILEERRKEGATAVEPEDQENEQASKGESTREREISKKQGLRARVADIVRGHSKLERKSSTKDLRRNPSNMSLVKRPR